MYMFIKIHGLNYILPSILYIYIYGSWMCADTCIGNFPNTAVERNSYRWPVESGNSVTIHKPLERLIYIESNIW